jgi:hypothetical protein
MFYPWKTLASLNRRDMCGARCIDIVIGIASIAPIFIAALALGGFSFIQPWLIVIPFVMFLAGWWRGRSFGNLWVKALALGAPTLLLFASFGQGRTKAAYLGAVLVISAVTVLPPAGGIEIRRRRAPDH